MSDETKPVATKLEKLRAAAIAMAAANKALVEAGLSPIPDKESQIAGEIQNAMFWEAEGRRPYYGG